LLASWLCAGSTPPGWLNSPGRQVILTHQARTALGLLSDLLGLGPDDEVLLPAYNCGAEVDPFVQAGCRVTFYQVDRSANANIADIRRRMSGATRLIHVTHFFGWPQDLEALSALCRERKVTLVEDCAQALFSEGTSPAIGKWGDAMIYSFVKFLALPDGGALVLNEELAASFAQMTSHRDSSSPELRPCCPRPEAGERVSRGGGRRMRPRAASTFKASLHLFKKWVMQHNPCLFRYAWGRRLLVRSWLPRPDHRVAGGRWEMLSSNRFLQSQRGWQMSRSAGGLLEQANPREIVARRRRNFSRFHDRLKRGLHLVPLHDSLPAGVCPLSYPVYAKDPCTARTFLEHQGIQVQGWPGYYPGMPWGDYPDACALKDNLLTLPVHQDLSLAQMDYIAQCANSLDR